MLSGILSREARYQLASQEEDIEISEQKLKHPSHQLRGTGTWRASRLSESRFCIWLSWILVVVLALSNFYQWKTAKEVQDPSQAVFSPASPAIRYENIVSTTAIGNDKSPYQGPPTPENNELWTDLYNFGVVRIPMSDAALLANRTVPIPGDPGYYAVTLDVFHELHCLNKIRLRLYGGEFYNQSDPSMGIGHLDHCIDMIRQNIMCSGDVTPLPFIWVKERQEALQVGKVLRTCRDFNAIRQWGIENQVHSFDRHQRVEDPLGNMEA